jgi:hypothetical protein
MNGMTTVKPILLAFFRFRHTPARFHDTNDHGLSLAGAGMNSKILDYEENWALPYLRLQYPYCYYLENFAFLAAYVFLVQK